ncbi:MAG: ParB/RepB/Spo0J family partition protein [Blautia sp.]|nr:ParB/RepB/Spo0J family partition protein [Blautia sp.]
MKNRIGQKIRLTSVEEMLGVTNEESAMEISLAKIRPFKDHPFKVLDDNKMQDLVESIRENGILTPVLIRPVGNDTYEMVSGHRRMHAASLLEMDAIPAIIREMSDDEAVVMMVDSNIQREELLPSEKAFAYKMKMDAMKRGGGRPTKDNSCQNGTNYRADNELSDQVGESARQVQRFIRLTELIPELLDYVDKKRIQFTVGVEISYLDKEIQQWVYEYIKENGILKLKQVTALREQLKDGGAITQTKMIALFQENQPGGQMSSNSNLTFTEKRLRQFFPPEYTADQMRTVIEDLLTEWRLKESEA